MRRGLTTRRVRGALLLALQLAGVAVPLADARLEVADGSVGQDVMAFALDRVGERSDRSGDATHLHDDCLLCQHLAQRQLSYSGTSPLPEPAWSSASRAADTAIRPATVRSLVERGRSPPMA